MSTITLELYITKPTGIEDAMKLDFPSTTTLGDVTLQIADRIGIPASQQQIKYNKNTIKLREDSLASLKLPNFAKLFIKQKEIKWADHIYAPEPSAFRKFIKTGVIFSVDTIDPEGKMGPKSNTDKSSSPIQFTFEVNRYWNRSYHPGDVISGKVMVNAIKAINATSLMVYFKGKEFREWEERPDSENNVSQEHHENHEHIREDIMVGHEALGSKIVQNGRLVPGTYEVPFEVHLPSHLPPSSFTHDKKNMFSGDKILWKKESVVYSFRARLKGSGTFKDYYEQFPIELKARNPPPESVQ